MRNRIHLVNALLLATLFVGSLVAFPDLPERIPAHFGAGGQPTRWEPASLWRWLLVPIVALATVALTYACAAVLPRRPELFNHPDKATFLALPPERRAPVIARMRAFLYGISSLVIALFALVQWMRWRTALGADPQGYVALTLVVGAMIAPISLGLWLPAIGREIREQSRAEEAGAERPGGGGGGGGVEKAP